MGTNNGKKIIIGALSAVAASVAAGVFVKKTIDKKNDNQNDEENKNEDKKSEVIKNNDTEVKSSKKNWFKKDKKSKKDTKNVYYTVTLTDIYSSYDDTTMSEDDMIEAIKRETSL